MKQIDKLFGEDLHNSEEGFKYIFEKLKQNYNAMYVNGITTFMKVIIPSIISKKNRRTKIINWDLDVSL